MTERALTDRKLAEMVYVRVYTGSKWKRWFWYFVYGHDASCLAETIFMDDEG